MCKVIHVFCGCEIIRYSNHLLLYGPSSPPLQLSLLACYAHRLHQPKEGLLDKETVAMLNEILDAMDTFINITEQKSQNEPNRN